MLQSASAATGLTPLARIVSTSHRDHRVFPDLPRPRARISRRRAASSPMFITVFVCMGLSPFDRPIRHPLGANNSCAFHARVRTSAPVGASRLHDGAAGHIRDVAGTRAGRARDRGATARRQQKTLIRTNAPLVQVRLRGAREPRAEGVRRRSAKEAQIFPYLFAPSPRTLEGRSGNGSRSNPAEGPAARRAVSYP